MKIIYKTLILAALLIINISLSANTIEVVQDGSGDYLEIQAAIAAAAHGDIVLVHPGTYYENVDLDGKNITLASLELTTGDESYIASTIIDGNYTGGCIKINSNEINVTIRGFTLKHGSGSWHQQPAGGGIFIREVYGCSIINCVITENKCAAGSGMYILWSSVYLEGNSIRNNGCGSGGGGMVIWDSSISYSTTNKNSVYNNFAGKGCDIYYVDQMNVESILDTVTVANPSEYYIGYDGDSSGSVSYENCFMEEVDSDIYVAAGGSDENSGLNPDQPMKTIAKAMQRVASNPDNPNTVYLADGLYEESEQIFPISMKSHVILKGESRENTILDGNMVYQSMVMMSPHAENLEVKSLTFQNGYSRIGIIDGMNIKEGLIFSNLLVQDCRINSFGAFHFDLGFDASFDDVIVQNVRANDKACIGISALGDISIKNSKFLNNMIDIDDPSDGAVGISVWGDVTIDKCEFVGNTIDSDEECSNASTLNVCGFSGEQGKFIVTNCLFAYNTSIGEPKSTVMIGSRPEEVVISNCTFVGNSSERILTVGGIIALRNNIFDDESDIEVFVPIALNGNVSEVNISHCNFAQGMESVVNEGNYNDINWLEGNIFEEPLFLESGENPYKLTAASPCIDAGTPDTLGLFIPPWDLLNNQRISDGNGDGDAIIDMGCYEYGAEPFVNSEPNEVPVLSGYNLVNYPNPFNPSTTISFSLNTEITENTEIVIYNVKGQRIVTLSDPTKADCIEGRQTHTINWHGTDNHNNPVSSGVYFAVLKSDDNRILASRKMMLLK